MLNVLQGSAIGEITVVVSRYFGGTKLGTGGMARAYGGAVSAVLQQVITTEKSVTQALSFCCDYQWSNLVEQLQQQFKAVIVEANYAENINYQLVLDVRDIDDFCRQIHQRSNGQILIKSNW